MARDAAPSAGPGDSESSDGSGGPPSNDEGEPDAHSGGAAQIDITGEVISFGLNFIVILVALFVVNLATLMLVSEEYGGENSLLPLQSFETQIVYHVQRAVGYDVELETAGNLSMPTVLDYPGMEDEDGDTAPAIEITGICAGFREMAVMSTLVLLVAGVRWRLKVVWAAALSGVIFAENLLRIFLIHPLAMAYGWDFAWNKFHTFFWEYGQLMTIVVLFVAWYMLVAMRDPVRPGWSTSELRYPPRPIRHPSLVTARRPAMR